MLEVEGIRRICIVDDDRIFTFVRVAILLPVSSKGLSYMHIRKREKKRISDTVVALEPLFGWNSFR